ncbi:nucleoside diphosphate sugar epimerase [Vibrio ishigakensis]|uniref:Nucleoside diphosphate sugar epimerase n=1 Tax=Vibrio ishigakensis TaxID=1481914 RepID=A0A0B8P6E8_9VIBR|nr:nucleoside diphosphate sugar epimerase [Vibrio ishigakensis]
MVASGASFLQQGKNVHVSNASAGGISESEQLGLSAHQLSFPLDSIDSYVKLLKELQITTVIGCITPGLRKPKDGTEPDWDSYAHKWQQICSGAKEAGVKKVVMISSTAVYPSRSGAMLESDASYEMALSDSSFSKKSVALLKGEQRVIDSGLDYVVIRCSGLVDEKRHPSRFVAHLKSVSNQAPANMLHRLDAVGITAFASESLANQVINASTPNTCSKAEFYQAALDSVDSSLELPKITEVQDKLIDSSLSERLGYSYRFKHTLELV